MKYTVTIEASSEKEIEALANLFNAALGKQTHTATDTIDDAGPAPAPAPKKPKKKPAPVVEDEEQQEIDNVHQENADEDDKSSDSDYTLEDITKALQKYCMNESKGDTAKGRAAARKILKKFKVDTPEELDPSEYSDFMDAIT